MCTWGAGRAALGAVGDENQDGPLRPLCLGGPAGATTVGLSTRGRGMTWWGGQREGKSGPGVAISGILQQLYHLQAAHPYIIRLDPSLMSA